MNSIKKTKPFQIQQHQANQWIRHPNVHVITQNYKSIHTVWTKQEYITAATAYVPIMSLQTLREKEEGQRDRPACSDSA